MKGEDFFLVQRHGSGYRVVDALYVLFYVILNVRVVVAHPRNDIAFYCYLQFNMVLRKTAARRLGERAFPDAGEVLRSSEWAQHQNKN
jgi:hypothetical protein